MQSFLGGKDIPCLPHDPHPRPSKFEQMYALGLKQLTPSVVSTASISKSIAIPTGPAAGRSVGSLPTRDKFRLIQNANYNDYCDLAVEVIKKFPNSNGYMELYVTDYTPNNALYDYPAPNGEDVTDEFGRYDRNNTLDNLDNNHNLNRDGDLYGHVPNVTGKRRDWPGPSGRHTLQVELLPPHAGYARDKVEEGSFVKLLNVRIKQGSAGKMEGNMWTDRDYPEKIKIQPLIEEKALKNLTNRRDNYWKANKNRIEEEEAKKQGKKPKRQKKKEQKARKAAIDGDEDSTSSTVLFNKHGMFIPLARYITC
jgi:protection-of-telomeres protein 1